MKRLPWIICGLLVAAGVAWYTIPLLGQAKAPIKVGLLHSLSGPLAISEKSMSQTPNAGDQGNQQDGLPRPRSRRGQADGRSDPKLFADQARRLIEVEKVSVIIGCWSSATRKSVKPVVEHSNHLLLYPVAYEGMEESPNIVYTGAAPNQQIIPTVKWSRDVLQAKSYFLIGSDSVYPRAVNEIVKDQLNALGATLTGEEYLGVGGGSMAEKVRKALDAKPDVILSTLDGDLFLPFYNKIRVEQSGTGKGKDGSTRPIPIISMNGTEEELRQLPLEAMTNDYLTCNYFQSIPRPENTEFIRKFKAEYGSDRVTSDTIVTAFESLMIWAQAVREAQTDEVGVIREQILRQSINAPEGVISVDSHTRHSWRPLFIGKIQSDGQIEIVWTTTKPIRPVPFPLTRSREEWESFLGSLQAGWNGNWSPPIRATDKMIR